MGAPLRALAIVVAVLAMALPTFADRPEDPRRRITVAVSTDQPSYPLGAPIQIEAIASYEDGSPVVDVRSARLRISDGTGRAMVRGNLDPQGNGRFSYLSTLPTDATPGLWQAEVRITDRRSNRGSQEISFEVAGAPGGCEDADGDGFTDADCGGDDCNDSNPLIHPGAEEICGDGVDQDCDGVDPECECPDADGDGFTDAACGGDDCDDTNPLIHPGAAEICGDGVDQDCSGSDLPCGDPHGTLTWNGAGTCLQCHTAEAHEVHGSVMYQWQGATPEMDHGPAMQGKIAGAVNSYCVNIEGNWGGCGSCHVGLGLPPEPEATQQQLENIDCMMCHQQAYRRVRVDGVFVPDEGNMAITMDEAARTVHRPERFNCLQCHAKAGGGDAVKRGDLTLAHAGTGDRTFDVHMATTGGNLRCQSCHTTSGHRVAGRGSDLRPSDSAVIVECSNCHGGMASGGHEGEDLDRHTARVACQTCHIPVYAKDAADSSATEATEIHRTWLGTHGSTPPIHPASITQNDLVPEYRWWNRMSRNYLIGDPAQVDPTTGRYPTSRPLGDVADHDSRLYAFKYKTAEQPITSDSSLLIALDTSVFFATGDAIAATEAGIANMGLPAGTPYHFVETDTFQMLNHEVSPHGMALQCSSCHGSTARMDLQGDLGYELKGPASQVCSQCHGYKSSKGFYENHDKHVKDKRRDCSWCHNFSRPERGLQMPN